MEILDMEITIEKHIYGGYILRYYMKPDYPNVCCCYHMNTAPSVSLKEAIRHFKNYIKEEEESIFVNQ